MEKRVNMGTAPLDPLALMAIFNTKNIKNTTPGKLNAVYKSDQCPIRDMWYEMLFHV